MLDCCTYRRLLWTARWPEGPFTFRVLFNFSRHRCRLTYTKYLISLLCVPDESTGMTPMHVAAKNGKAEFVKAVISAMSGNAQFDARDNKGNTVYHYAATANKETIEVIRLIELLPTA